MPLITAKVCETKHFFIQQITCQHFIYQSQNILNSIFLENIAQNTNKHANISRTILPHKEVKFSIFNTRNNQTRNRKSNLLKIKTQMKFKQIK
jgi:hypothetical protein